MYLSILILPLLGSLVSGLLGRKLGVTGAHIITCTCLILSSILATIAFYEVGICGSPVSVYLVNWVDSEFMSISWEFLFDQLTVSMYIPILYISSLIHIFSTDYMSEDPHNQRFFSYLSLFTFFMLLLVSGANFFVMFVGWEGKVGCLIWENTDNLQYSLYISNIKYKSGLAAGTKYYEKGRTFYMSASNPKLVSTKRIGPHNIDIISIIVGSTLGDSHLEKRQNGLGTRIIFEQSNKNVEYLMWFHSYLSTRGYCNTKPPKLHKRIKQNGEIFFHYRINSYTFSSLNWIHNMFYSLVQGKYIKFIPFEIEEYLTPMALAIWFMDDGSKCNKGAKISTNCFTPKELITLCDLLYIKYQLICTVQSGGKNKGSVIYISVKSMPLFSKLVKPFMLPSLYYKLGDY